MLLRMTVDSDELAERIVGWETIGDMARFLDSLFGKLDDQDMEDFGALMGAASIRKLEMMIKGHETAHKEPMEVHPEAVRS